MFKIVTNKCQFTTKEAAQNHVDNVLSKSPKIIESGTDHSEKLGWHSWWKMEEFVNNKIEEEEE